MTIAAKVSTASPFPDGERPERADVVLLNAEDDIGDTIRPRLEAAGADLARCWVLPDVHPEGHPPRPPELPADLFLLEDLVKSKAAALIVIDPLMAFLSGQVDSHRDRGRLAAALRGPGAGGPPAHPRHRRPATARGGHRMNRVQYPATLQLRGDGDGRTIEGPLLPWGVEARVLDRNRLVIETFQRGALADADPARVPLTAPPRDPGTLPIGVTLSIEDRADAAWGAWHVSDTTLGNEVLALARDGVPPGLSVGFREVPGGSRWSADRRRVTRTRAELDHVAVVRVPAYVGAGVVGVRSVAPAEYPLLSLAQLMRRG